MLLELFKIPPKKRFTATIGRAKKSRGHPIELQVELMADITNYFYVIHEV